MLNKYPPIVKLINSFMNVLTNLLWCIHTGLVQNRNWEQDQDRDLGRMGCMVLIRTFHTAPEQGQGRTPGTFSGPEEWVWYPFFRS